MKLFLLKVIISSATSLLSLALLVVSFANSTVYFVLRLDVKHFLIKKSIQKPIMAVLWLRILVPDPEFSLSNAIFAHFHENLVHDPDTDQMSPGPQHCR
jgi:hypothetical protein